MSTDQTAIPYSALPSKKRDRGRPLRIEAAEQIFFVTSRILDSAFWLHPLLCSRLEPVNREARRSIAAKRAQLDAVLARLVERANKRRPPEQPHLTLREAKTLAENLFPSALARAREACAKDNLQPPEVFTVLVMSNHVHLVIRAPSKNLAAFVGYFKARVATTLNLLLGRTGNVWARRYDAQAVLTDEAAIGRVRYTLENPVKARLVRHVDEWPGFVALAGRDDGENLQAHWFDWTAWHRARCPHERSSFMRTSSLPLHKLPSLAGRDDADYVRDLVDDLTPLGEHERVLGLERVLQTDVDARPARTKRARRPYAFGDRESVRRYFQACCATYAAYALCSERLRRGEAVNDWPEGTYAPGVARAA